MTDVVIRTENLKKNFGQLEVLKGIDVSIRKGEVVSIIGPSGGGKSTFLRCLNLLETPTDGKVFFKGQDITDKKMDTSKFRQQIGMVFQNFNVFPNMTVLENITLTPILEKKIPKAQAEEEAYQEQLDHVAQYPSMMQGVPGYGTSTTTNNRSVAYGGINITIIAQAGQDTHDIVDAVLEELTVLLGQEEAAF